MYIEYVWQRVKGGRRHHFPVECWKRANFLACASFRRACASIVDVFKREHVNDGHLFFDFNSILCERVFFSFFFAIRIGSIMWDKSIFLSLSLSLRTLQHQCDELGPKMGWRWFGYSKTFPGELWSFETNKMPFSCITCYILILNYFRFSRHRYRRSRRPSPYHRNSFHFRINLMIGL